MIYNKKERKLKEQDDLRTKVKMLKALQGFKYSEITEYINIKQSSVYSWLNRQFNLSTENALLLRNILEDIEV